jgi:hypothetical protein
LTDDERLVPVAAAAAAQLSGLIRSTQAEAGTRLTSAKVI